MKALIGFAILGPLTACNVVIGYDDLEPGSEISEGGAAPDGGAGGQSTATTNPNGGSTAETTTAGTAGVGGGSVETCSAEVPCANGMSCDSDDECISGRCVQDVCDRWSLTLSGPGDDFARAVAVDSNGSVVLGGSFFDTLDVGTDTLVAHETWDQALLVKLGRDGTPQWWRSWGLPGVDDRVFDVAVDANDNVIATGHAAGPVSFGGASLSTVDRDAFVVKLASDGSHLWSRVFGGTNTDQGRAVATDGAGNVIVTGMVFDTIDLGCGVHSTGGAYEAFAAKLSAIDGSCIWSKTFGPNHYGWSNAVAVDGAGDVILVGQYYGTMTLDSASITSDGSYYDGFVFKLSGATGSALWARSHGEQLDELALDVAAGATGTVYVTGYFGSPSVDFGGGFLISEGNEDVYAVSYDATGTHRWSKSFGGAGRELLAAIALDGFANPTVALSFQSTTVELDGSTETNSMSDATSDGLVTARHAADGAELISEAFGGAGNDHINSIAVDPVTNNVVIVGENPDGDIRIQSLGPLN